MKVEELWNAVVNYTPETLVLGGGFMGGMYLGTVVIQLILCGLIGIRENRAIEHWDVAFVAVVVAGITAALGAVAAWGGSFKNWAWCFGLGFNTPFYIRAVANLIQDRRILKEIKELKVETQKLSKRRDRTGMREGGIGDTDNEEEEMVDGAEDSETNVT